MDLIDSINWLKELKNSDEIQEFCYCDKFYLIIDTVINIIETIDKLTSKEKQKKNIKSDRLIEQDIYERAYEDRYKNGSSDGRFFAYNKAIDDFVISIKEELNRFEVKNLDTCVLFDLMNRKAEQLKWNMLKMYSKKELEIRNKAIDEFVKKIKEYNYCRDRTDFNVSACSDCCFCVNKKETGDAICALDDLAEEFKIIISKNK